MAWLALCDHEDRRFSLRGLGIDKMDTPILPDYPHSLLTRGSIMFETRLSADGRPQVLFGYKNTYPSLRSLTFQAIPGGGIALVQVQGDAIAHAAIQHREAGRTDVVRITYSWDSTVNWGRMTLEMPEETHVSSVYLDNPQPLSLDDIRDLMLGRNGQTFATDMIFAALSDQIEPIGPMPTLLPSTPLATPWGYKTVQSLRRGDTVNTRDDGVVPVLQRVQRHVPARGSYRPIRLRAPYFGLQDDVIVAPDQRLIIDGPEVEYLFSQEAVLVPARHLVNGFAALTEPCGPVINYAQLLLPRHETLIAAGTAVESIYVGRIRRNEEHLQSSLLHAFDRARLPEHPRPAHHVLRWYDAIHLARRRAA
ncbi:Hint 2 domain containing protein [Sulfitobacter noctilucae]|uniref:Hint domain-containing protein n=1 Tax=Sulfitobacter noctilucae TaxID=1342302 RepID=UPI000469E72E|nr:Hint domain-containing protein [Sulfitobacter noctilucae]KIN65895.1 Hint 2 domain containing protein [Sulfitobacter noctilucae]